MAIENAAMGTTHLTCEFKFANGETCGIRFMASHGVDAVVQAAKDRGWGVHVEPDDGIMDAVTFCPRHPTGEGTSEL